MLISGDHAVPIKMADRTINNYLRIALPLTQQFASPAVPAEFNRTGFKVTTVENGPALRWAAFTFCSHATV